MDIKSYEWNNIRFTDVFRVKSGNAGTKFFRHGRTDIFQLSLKISGISNIVYNYREYQFSAESILYLPKETSADIDYRTTISEKGESLCIFFTSLNKLPQVPILIKQTEPQTRNLFFELFEAYLKDKTFESMSIFYKILSSIDKKLTESAPNGADKTANAILYMQNHVKDKYIDVAVLAKLCNMSIDYFRHKFKSAHNISPLQYFHKLKIDYIKSLIHSREYSINEIAQMAGFDDLNYFSRFFKAHVGTSPGKYKKTCLM